jgi:hypothetical protein
MYWYGTPHPKTGVNLATCIWQTRAHAVAANSRPHHIRAMRLAAASYEMYDLEVRQSCFVSAASCSRDFSAAVLASQERGRDEVASL